MEHNIKKILELEYKDAKAPLAIKQNLHRSIEHLSLVKTLIEFFAVSPIIVIQGLSIGNINEIK